MSTRPLSGPAPSDPPLAPSPRRTLWARWQDLNPLYFDVPLAVILVFLGCLGISLGSVDEMHTRAPDAGAYLLMIIGMGSVAVRRRYPLTVAAVTVVVTLLYTILEYPENSLPFAFLFALYTVAAWEDLRRSLIVFVVMVGAVILAVSLDFNEIHISEIFNTLAIFGVAYLVGVNMRSRRAYLAQLELRAADLERTRHEEAERAVAEERLRVARELHDVVAHTMSVVAVQSGIAAHVMDKKPDEARRMLDNITATSKDALDEMRALLGVLRSETDDGEPADLAPAPTLDDLGSLVDSVTGAGIPVTLHVDGERPAITKGVDLSAYRIVQEALTNVLKHAGTANVQVNVTYAPDSVLVEVLDDGRGAAARANGDRDGAGATGSSGPSKAGDGGGHGIVGMRERVSVYGGTLDAGPRPGGGFRVAATLPFPTT